MADMTLKMLLLGQDVTASKAIKGVGKHIDESEGKFHHWGAVAGAAGAIAGLAVLKFGKDSVSAYTDAQSQQAKLHDAFRKFPALADTNQAALGRLNTQLEKKTKFDDDATASGQATLAQFKLTGGQITALTPLLQDYAAKTGKDLPTAATDFGKAMLGQGRALKGVGLNFKDTGSASGNFTELMGGLRTQVGGFAQNEGKTAAGQTEIMKNQFGELEESVGSKLVPALMTLTGVLISVIGFVSRNASVIGPLVVILGGLAAVVYAIITAQKIWTAVQLAFNIVMDANPIGLIILAIAALILIIVIAWKHSETFRAIVLGALHGIQAGFWATVHAIQTAWGAVYNYVIRPVARAAVWVAGKLGDVVGWFRGIPGKIGTAFGKLAGIIEAPFKAAFAFIMAGIHAVMDAFNAVKTALGGGGPSHPLAQSPAGSHGLRGHAAGGIFTRPTVGLIGEAGPEALIPLSAGRGGAGGLGGTTIQITVQGALDPVAVGRQIESVMQKLNQRTGRPAQFTTV